MKKAALALAAVAALAIPALASADPNYRNFDLDLHGSLGAYGDYQFLNVPAGDIAPHGFGGGVMGDLGFFHSPYGKLYGTVEYQYNHPEDEGLALRTNQVRSGLGYTFPAFDAVNFGARVDYVHYDYTEQGFGQNVGLGNSDGLGYHGNAKFNLTRHNGYAPATLTLEGGYLDLSQFNGPEARVQLDVPVARHMTAFVGYQYDRYHIYGSDTHYNYNDARLGLTYHF